MASGRRSQASNPMFSNQQTMAGQGRAGGVGEFADYDAEKELCKTFLSTFTLSRDEGRGLKYMDQLQEVANRARQVIGAAWPRCAALHSPASRHFSRPHT